MTATVSLRRLYLLTAMVAILGFVWYFARQGPRSALGFLLGAAISFGNLWLFDWLARAIAPAGAPPKPWKAGAFVGRYLILFTAGYVIVNALGVNPLPVVLGLFASTAAVLVAITLELFENLLNNRRAH
jgi:ATP synthase I chain